MKPPAQLSGEDRRLERLWLWARIAMLVMVVRGTIGIVMGYVDYFPPNFHSEFLTGRQHYFFGPYQVAFWIHIVASPAVMLSGAWLLSSRLRRRYPAWHRRLGRIHTLIVLVLVAPSGLWMSLYALSGLWAGSAFTVSSLAVFLCGLMGWRSAIKKRFAQHQIWMTRCYLLLCSAIVLRLLSGLATVLNSDQIWTYPAFAWISTLAPVAVYEILRMSRWALGPNGVDLKSP